MFSKIITFGAPVLTALTLVRTIPDVNFRNLQLNREK